MRRFLAAVSLVVAVCVPLGGGARAEPPPPPEPMSLEALLDLVVTATLRKQSTFDAPAAITVVSAAEIRERGYRTLKAIMNDVAGFNDVSDTNEEIVAVRGVFTSTTNKILVLVNGHRMNDLMLGRYNVDQFLGLHAVEQVEFIRGPASALYGTGALVGIVNVITKPGADLGGGEVKLQAGPHAQELSCNWGALLAGYDLFFNFTYLDARGQERAQDARLDRPPAGQTQAPGRIYLGRYPENLSALVTLRGDSSAIALRAAHFRRVPPRGSNGSFYDYDAEPFKPAYTENDFFVDYQYSAVLGAAGATKLRFNPSVHFFSYYEQSFITYGSNRVPPLGQRSGMQGEFNNYQLKLTLEHQVAGPLNLIAGLDGLLASFYRSDAVAITGGHVELSPAGYTPTGRWFLGGAFLQAIYTPAPTLTLTLGARFDTFQGEADAQLTPRVGVVYRPRESLAFKLLYGRSYLAPMWAHKRANDSQFKGNPNLAPESFHGADLIALYAGARATASVDLFLNQTTGLINGVRQGDPARPIFPYQNSGESLYAGLEATGEVQLGPWLRGVGSYAHIRPVGGAARTSGSLRIGDRIADIAHHTLRAGLRFEPSASLRVWLWGRGYSETATVEGVARSDGPNETANAQIPAVFVLDASVTYDWRDFTFQLRGTNLGDRAYERGGTTIRPLARPGRDVEAALFVRF